MRSIPGRPFGLSWRVRCAALLTACRPNNSFCSLSKFAWACVICLSKNKVSGSTPIAFSFRLGLPLINVLFCSSLVKVAASLCNASVIFVILALPAIPKNLFNSSAAALIAFAMFAKAVWNAAPIGCSNVPTDADKFDKAVLSLSPAAAGLSAIVFAASPYSLNSFSANFWKSCKLTWPFSRALSSSWGVMPKDSANKLKAPGKRSPICWRSSSAETLPLLNTCEVAVSAESKSCKLPPVPRMPAVTPLKAFSVSATFPPAPRTEAESFVNWRVRMSWGIASSLLVVEINFNARWYSSAFLVTSWSASRCFCRSAAYDAVPPSAWRACPTCAPIAPPTAAPAGPKGSPTRAPIAPSGPPKMPLAATAPTPFAAAIAPPRRRPWALAAACSNLWASLVACLNSLLVTSTLFASSRHARL